MSVPEIAYSCCEHCITVMSASAECVTPDGHESPCAEGCNDDDDEDDDE